METFEILSILNVLDDTFNSFLHRIDYYHVYNFKFVKNQSNDGLYILVCSACCFYIPFDELMKKYQTFCFYLSQYVSMRSPTNFFNTLHSNTDRYYVDFILTQKRKIFSRYAIGQQPNIYRHWCIDDNKIYFWLLFLWNELKSNGNGKRDSGENSQYE